jgi:Tol biopolymer transport system component
VIQRVLIALLAAPIVVAGYQAGRPVVRSQLAWVDRAGKRLSTLGGVGDYGNIELSPDRKHVAVAIQEQPGVHELSVYDVSNGRRTMVTANAADQNWLIWSPDGRRVVFNSARNGGLDLYQVSASRSAKGDEETLLVDRLAKWPVSWSPDGRFLLYVTSGERTGNDIWVLPLSGDRKPYPFLQTAAAENWAAFSPDGRLVAYSSTESGEAEVYVTTFPRTNLKWVVSTGGGSQARWRRDGKELYYLGLDRNLMAVPVLRLGADPEFGVAEPLFQVRLPYGQYHAYDAADDGQRFLINALVGAPGVPAVAAH